MLVPAKGGLAGAGSVIQTFAMKSVFVGQAKSIIFDAGSTNYRAGHQFCAVRKVSNTLAGGELRTHTFAGKQHFGTETASLDARAFGEFHAADAGGKTKIIFDLGAAASLTANRISFHDYGLEVFRGAIDGGAEAGWASSIDG